VFTARYALSPYIKQIRFVFKGLITTIIAIKINVVINCSLILGLMLFFRNDGTLLRSEPLSSSTDNFLNKYTALHSTKL
jgi:hypothetical protein